MKKELWILKLFAASVVCLCASAWGDDYYYLTAGDQQRMTIVDLNTHAWWQAPLSGNEYAIAVFQNNGEISEVTVGAYRNNGAFYNSAGTFLTSLNNANTIQSSQWLDGTTDGTHNYTVDFYNGNVYQTDTSFNNAHVLFTPGGALQMIGITYDTGSDLIWIADRYGNPGRITEYFANGLQVYSFNTGISNISALAYQESHNTLWVTTTLGCANGGTCLYEYDKTGNLLSSFSIPVYDNIIGGEINPVPEPGTLLLFGSGALGVIGVIRLKLSV
jgi:hypothetical protein